MRISAKADYALRAMAQLAVEPGRAARQCRSCLPYTCGRLRGPSSSSSNAPELRLGYCANLTHAAALVGVKDGIFATALGPQTELKTNVEHVLLLPRVSPWSPGIEQKDRPPGDN